MLVGDARDVVKQYGSDFFQGIMVMPLETQKAVIRLYKFVRVADEIVDNNGDIVHARKELEEYRDARKRAYDNHDFDDEQFGNIVRLFYAFEIESAYSDAFFEAMLMDTEKFRYETYDNLKKYIYGSADVIGLMMTDIMGYDFDPKNEKNADKLLKARHCAAKLGEAFQLSNFLRDVHEDWHLGRVYLPQDTLQKYHISDDDFARYSETRLIDSKFAQCMEELVVFCDAMHDEANEGIQLLNPSCQKAIRLSSDLHREILTKIRNSNYNVFDKAFDKNSYGRMMS